MFIRVLLTILGILIALSGLVWFLQGINILPGSVMTGQTQWVVYGALAMIIGCSLAIFANRRRGNRVN